MAEKHYEKWVCKSAEDQGYLVRKVSWLGIRSAPDRLFIRGGRTIWIEFKDQGEPPTVLQANEHARMRSHGAEVHVIDSPQLAAQVLQIELLARYAPHRRVRKTGR